MNNKSLLPNWRAKIVRRYKKFQQCFIKSDLPWFERVARWCQYRGKTRIIHDREGDEPYLERFYFINLRPFSRIVIHRFWKSDDDGGLHDHPWSFAGSKILKGGYYEHIIDKNGKHQRLWRDNKTPLRWFGGTYLHRVELENEGDEVWTLFIMGPKYRRWGFVPYNGDGEWVYWQDYITRKLSKKYQTTQ